MFSTCCGTRQPISSLDITVAYRRFTYLPLIGDSDSPRGVEKHAITPASILKIHHMIV